LLAKGSTSNQLRTKVHASYKTANPGGLASGDCNKQNEKHLFFILVLQECYDKLEDLSKGIKASETSTPSARQREAVTRINDETEVMYRINSLDWTLMTYSMKLPMKFFHWSYQKMKHLI
jgi:hypothetical protein